jgi:archaetidylinositol phosphate synthase
MNVWRERLGRWLAPLARHCPFSPNAISLLALILNLCAAGCLFHARTHPRLFLVAVLLLATGGLLDAFDGVVARVQEKTSRYGDFLDHTFDRISDLALAAAWLLGSNAGETLTIVALLVVMLNGYIGTQIEATFGQRNYESVGRGEFVIALIAYPIVSWAIVTHGLSNTTFGGWRIVEWLTFVLLAFGLLGMIQRLVLAHRLGRQ